MTRDLIVGLDAGTSVIKAVAFTPEGAQVAAASVSNQVDHVAEGGAEQDAERTWRDAARTLRLLAEQVPALATRTAGLAVTGQGDGTWLIDAAGAPVAPAWLWLDARSGAIVDRLRRNGVGEQVARLTGTGLSCSSQSGQLLWLLAHRPEVLERAATAFHCKDWLYFRCTGERATDPSEGVFTFGDFRTRDYADAVLALLGLSSLRRLLPPIVDGTKHWARLNAAAAGATGLIEGTPVVLAPLDVLCTGLGAGLYDPARNIGCTILGSTGMHMRLHHRLDDIGFANQVGYTTPFVGGTWVGMTSNMAASLNIDWLMGAIERGMTDVGVTPPPRRDLLARFDRLAGEAAPGRVIYHPFIAEAGERGPFVEPKARAQILGLTDGVSFADVMRGIYEGLGFAARDCYDAMGHRPEEIRLGGGVARSPVCRQILAAVLDAPVRLAARDEAGAAGAAMVACLALGHYPDVAAACARWVEPALGPPLPPDPALAAKYARLFEVYRAGYRGMTGVWHALDRVRTDA
jgi:erythritol kinase (D-erythritol 1-phosphate-forming)